MAYSIRAETTFSDYKSNDIITIYHGEILHMGTLCSLPSTTPSKCIVFFLGIHGTQPFQEVPFSHYSPEDCEVCPHHLDIPAMGDSSPGV